jgi:hypothetical protein
VKIKWYMLVFILHPMVYFCLAMESTRKKTSPCLTLSSLFFSGRYLSLYGSEDVSEPLKGIARFCNKKHNTNKKILFKRMNETTKLAQNANPAFSINTIDALIIWFNDSLLSDLPIIQEFIVDHEIGHFKKRDHLKKTLEEKSGGLFGGICGVTTLFSCMPKLPMPFKVCSLNAGITFGLLSVMKMTLDQSSWYKNLRDEWYKKLEYQAHEYAIDMSKDPQAVYDYLENQKK